MFEGRINRPKKEQNSHIEAHGSEDFEQGGNDTEIEVYEVDAPKPETSSTPLMEEELRFFALEDGTKIKRFLMGGIQGRSSAFNQTSWSSNH